MSDDQNLHADPLATGAGSEGSFDILGEAMKSDGTKPIPPVAITTPPASGDQKPNELWPNGRPERPTDPKQDPKRVEYWQSQTDKFKAKYEKVAPWEPVLQHIQDSPELKRAIEDSMLNRAPRVQSPQPQVTPTEVVELEMPSAPVKPANFDPLDNDPASESYKYRLAKEEYRDQLTQVMIEREIARDRKTKADTQRAARMQEEEAKKREVSAQLSTAFGFTPAEVDDFFKVMADPKSVNVENLARLYRMINQGTQPKEDSRIKKELEALEKEKLSGLPPEGGELPSPETEEDAFNADFLRRGKVSRLIL